MREIVIKQNIFDTKECHCSVVLRSNSVASDTATSVSEWPATQPAEEKLHVQQEQADLMRHTAKDFMTWQWPPIVTADDCIEGYVQVLERDSSFLGEPGPQSKELDSLLHVSEEAQESLSRPRSCHGSFLRKPAKMKDWMQTILVWSHQLIHLQLST